ncbi:hypothetical protein [Vibrio vulnificus YJ016]|uniref:Uncharacterized protein n=1 Tax=Vibrio vulnificus (strain YJ016) TaxID=196600 RepID=Q7ML14_VIBVY|nr:hypothetical protein [Vibrio vulnificus YJ016]
MKFIWGDGDKRVPSVWLNALGCAPIFPAAALRSIATSLRSRLGVDRNLNRHLPHSNNSAECMDYRIVALPYARHLNCKPY